MSDAVERLGGYFVDTGRLTPATLARARHACQESGEPLGAVLVSLGLVPEREVAAAFAAVLDLPLAGPHDYPAEPVLEHRLGVKFLRQARVLPLRDEPGRLVLAMADPGDGFALQALSVAAGKPVEPWAAVPADLEQAFARLYATGETVAPGPLEETGAVFEATQDDVERLKDLASEAPVIRFVNGLIARAVEARASDIHLEPFEASLRIRFRIDGDLREVENPPRRMAPAVVSRIKIMARLNIAERRLPQDGRIKMTVRGRAIDLRVSTVPTLHGEGVALRVLDRSSVRLDFAELGFSDDERRLWRDVLAKPNGIVLVTGPTGSGKTTTLYTSLVEMNTPDRKLFSIEDPIEYHLEGINQIQVHPQIGLSFANILRAILRQDPDIIMVGEIRDAETAEMAIQSALTGHLVLSTLHTNDAASSITRLLDMGVEGYLLTTTINAVAAQRLVRCLCPQCREPYRLTPDMARPLGLIRLAEESEPVLYRAKGCPACHGTGYFGRVGILEILVLTDALRPLILAQADAGTIADAARRDGMRSLVETGMAKALAGVTSLEEILRVARPVS